MSSSTSQNPDPYYLKVPFAQRWELFKPTIRALYIDEDLRVSQVAKTMREQYRFDAVEHQYKYYFKKWAMTKSVPSAKKEAAIKALGKRLREGTTSTSLVTYKGDRVDKRRLRRHMLEQERALKKSETLELGSNIFIRWNLPYGALRYSSFAFPSSPHGTAASTPSDLYIASPHATSGHSMSNAPLPSNAPSPVNAPSPTMLVLRTRQQRERTRLFIEGHSDDLLLQLHENEKEALTTWLHQFWLFSYKTVKHWGSGPTEWTLETLEFHKYGDKRSAHSPYMWAIGFDAHSPNIPMTTARNDKCHCLSENPCNLCGWKTSPEIYARPDCRLDNSDEEAGWAAWPSCSPTLEVEQKLYDGLESNHFSTVDINILPVSATQIVEAVRDSPAKLLGQAFGFAIIARNRAMISNILERVREGEHMDIVDLFPYHLATAFLNGSRKSWNIFNQIIDGLKHENPLIRLYINDKGHTVLDNLMITILKSHTSCPPVIVDDTFKNLKRFPGEEVDICGRWNPDSRCIRARFSEGHASIPMQWKHRFCHTSVKFICHCLRRVFGFSYSPDINTPSGLFLKRCNNCGEELQLLPLQCLVMTVFHLAHNGCEGENLFGAVACLACLLAKGANPFLKASISLPALLGTDTDHECTHQKISAVELMDLIPQRFMETWSTEARLGWDVFCGLLRYAENELRGNTSYTERELMLWSWQAQVLPYPDLWKYIFSA
ncbi:Clr5 domain protein [Rutstroemia sp. NJR-2017a WRK4]|nr:Clr5 domain protein [Rutstroemia sp. NJR-2017a WRK4]